MEEDGFIIVPKEDELPANPRQIYDHVFLSDIDHVIEELRPLLWPLNKFIHDNPELAFKEYKAHDALTNFMNAQNGWKVTKSAFGMETAWMAVFDSGKTGPAVSFNAEMGTQITPSSSLTSFADKMTQTHSPTWAMHVGTTLSQQLPSPPLWRPPESSSDITFQAKFFSLAHQGRKALEAGRYVSLRLAPIKMWTYP